MSDDPSGNPYGPPAAPPPPPDFSSPYSGPPPAVIKWQWVYCISMTLLYVAVIGVGLFLFLGADQLAAYDPTTDPEMMRLLGVIYGGLGVVLAVVFAVGLFWRRGMGGWVYNLVLICIGLTSCITWPATIPLIIYWIKAKDHVAG